MGKKKSLLSVAIVIVGCTCLFMGIRICNRIFVKLDAASKPKVAVSVITEELENQNFKVKWMVRNDADYDITFNGENIRICTIDRQPFQFEDTLETTIVVKPNDKYWYEFETGALTKGYHEIKMTAACEEGTTGSFIVQVQVGEDMLSESPATTNTSTPTSAPSPTNLPTPTVSSLPLSKYETKDSIKIDANHFPDEYFRQYVSLAADGDNDGILTLEERNSLKSIESYALAGNELDEELRIASAEKKELILQAKSLEGVQYFKELEELIITHSASKMAALEELSLENPKLVTLKIDSLNMKKLELGDCPELVTFSVGFVKCADEVKVPVSEKLETVIVSAPLINISGIVSAVNMEKLIISGALTETRLDLTRLTELRSLECLSASEVEELDVSTAAKLYKISRIEGVKKLILHNELVEVEGENLPKLEYAGNTSSIVTVLEKLKNRIAIPESYSLTDYSVKETGGVEKWTYSWEKDKRKLNITCDADANVFLYSDTGADDVTESIGEVITVEELKEKAESILKIFFPEADGKLECTRAENEKRISYIFNLEYARVKNGIPVKGNTLKFKFNYYTGELMSFMGGEWFEEADLTEVGNGTSVEEARLTLGYFLINNQILPAYVTDEMLMFVGDVPEKYTEKEITDLTLITADEAKKVITENKQLYLDEKAAYVKVTTYERTYSGGRKGYVHKLIFKESETARRTLATAYVDAESGRLLGYSAYTETYTYAEAKAENIKTQYSTEQKKELAENFLRAVNQEYFAETMLSDIQKCTVLYLISEDNAIMRGENFKYCRVVNGIPYFANHISVTVDGLTGKIYEYSICWDEQAVFAPLNGMLDEAAVFNRLLKNGGCELVYKKELSGEIVLKYELAYKEAYIDANTGEYIE